MNKDIPLSSRVAVKARANGHCERCGMPCTHGHWHHRRSRSVRDDLTHDPRNGAYLCPTCHRSVHAEPFGARADGWIVSRYADPRTEPIKHWSLGTVYIRQMRYSITEPSFTDETE